jgi:hypothetical protein
LDGFVHLAGKVDELGQVRVILEDRQDGGLVLILRVQLGGASSSRGELMLASANCSRNCSCSALTADMLLTTMSLLAFICWNNISAALFCFSENARRLWTRSSMKI